MNVPSRRLSSARNVCEPDALRLERAVGRGAEEWGRRSRRHVRRDAAAQSGRAKVLDGEDHLAVALVHRSADEIEQRLVVGDERVVAVATAPAWPWPARSPNPRRVPTPVPARCRYTFASSVLAAPREARPMSGPVYDLAGGKAAIASFRSCSICAYTSCGVLRAMRQAVEASRFHAP